MPEREDLGGRPSQYDASFCGHVRRLARLNLPLTNAALAKYFGVCDRTIQRWKSQNPEFLHSADGVQASHVSQGCPTVPFP